VIEEQREAFEKSFRRFQPEGGSFERLVRRRDRKRRNQRITAGVVGITVFVAAVWIVTSGGVFDRSETSVVPAGEVTGPAETAPPPVRAPAAPDVVRKHGRCSPGGFLWYWRLTDVGDEIKVRFDFLGGVDFWHFVLRHGRAGPDFPPFDQGDGIVFFEDTMQDTCCGAGILIVESVWDREGEDDGFAAKAVNTRTGRVCKTQAVI
jgi:hypothetical protein